MRNAVGDRRLWFGVIISGVALWFALKGVDGRAVLSTLAAGDYRWLGPAIAAVVVGQCARAQRWRVLFGAGLRPTFRQAFLILNVGYLVSTILPLRLGDPVRAWLVETRSPAGGAEALASVVVERALDMVTILVLLAFYLPGPAAELLTDVVGSGWWVAPTALRIAAVVGIAAAYVGLIIAASFAEPVGRALDRVGAAGADGTSRLGRQTRRFLSAFGALRSPWRATLAFTWSLIVWFIGALSFWAMMPAVGLDLPFAAAVLALGATALFAIVPSSPGYIGVFHAGVVAGLLLYAPIARESAVGYAFVLHAMTYLTLILMGIVGMAGLGLRWGGVTERREIVGA